MSFTLVNHRNEKVKTFDSRSTAEEKMGDMQGLGVSPDKLEIVHGAYESYAEYAENLETVGNQQASEGMSDSSTEVVEEEPDEVIEPEDYSEQIPDKPSVDTDPLAWMPSEFTDTIDGSVAINRKGFSVLKQHYDISVESECVVGPEETDYTFCRVKAVAETPDGTRSEAHGSAHIERGDDPWLLLEMADTRAKKRSLSDATGIGMVAVSELQNDL